MVRRRLPPLNAVRAFESAARLGSFVAAAEELHVTQPAIGRHVKLLEEWIGTALFDRTPRGVLLTDEGRRYFEQTRRALNLIAEASHQVSARAREHWLRLLVVPGLATRWLAPRLAQFRALHPDIRIALEPNASFTEVRAEQADLGIAYGQPDDFRGPSEVLLRPAIFPVCAPALLERLGPFHEPAELLAQPLLHEDDGSWWSDWFVAQGVRARLSAQISYASADQVIALALAGSGIALTNALLVQQELADGRLVRPVPQQVELEPYLLLAPGGILSPGAALFRSWLREVCAVED